MSGDGRFTEAPLQRRPHERDLPSRHGGSLALQNDNDGKRRGYNDGNRAWQAWLRHRAVTRQSAGIRR